MNYSKDLPSFSHINPTHIEPQLDKVLQQQRTTIHKLLQQQHFSWANLMQPLEDLTDELNQMWSPIGHLHNVLDSAPLREAYNACIPKLSDFGTEIGQNFTLFKAIELIDQTQTDELDKAQRKILKNNLRDFKLSGVALSDADKQKFAELSKKLSQLCTRFEENVMDATMAWHKHVTDEKQLQGIPAHAKHAAQVLAQQRNVSGWVFSLEYPSYLAVITYADDRALREEIYYAFTTRASELGVNPEKLDNSKVMLDILECRLQLARLLGFNNFAERSLATKMVHDTTKVLEFLQQLVHASRKKAEVEFAELKQFAADEVGLTDLQAWDIAYTSEKLCQQRYAISQEELRPYFPEYKVTAGLFAIVAKLFNVRIEEVRDFDRYHPDVRCYALFDKNDQIRSYCYFDLYARENKRGGAWMDDCRSRRLLANGEVQIPIAYVNCNFNGPVNGDPALFTHSDVVTLFHEFGHALQHMLTKVNYLEVAGINGVPWDAVEVSSQFLENWAWEKQSIGFITEHYETKQPLPEEMFDRMHRAKNFQTAMQMMRQIEFALFDFRLHLEFDPKQTDQIAKILTEVRSQVAVIPVPAFNRFIHGFSHIFGGGYAAGYYSYKWAEVMAADAFDLFLEHGIFDANSSNKFLHTFLESGGVEEPLDLFIALRGREPEVTALLRQSGIS